MFYTDTLKAEFNLVKNYHDQAATPEIQVVTQLIQFDFYYRYSDSSEQSRKMQSLELTLRRKIDKVQDPELAQRLRQCFHDEAVRAEVFRAYAHLPLPQPPLSSMTGVMGCYRDQISEYHLQQLSDWIVEVEQVAELLKDFRSPRYIWTLATPRVTDMRKIAEQYQNPDFYGISMPKEIIDAVCHIATSGSRIRLNLFTLYGLLRDPLFNNGPISDIQVMPLMEFNHRRSVQVVHRNGLFRFII